MSGNAEIQEVAGIINLVLTELLVSLRLLDLSLRRHLLSQLADHLKSEEFQFNTPAQKRILEKAVEFSRRLFWILLCSCSSDVLVHVVVVPALHNFQTLPLKMDLVFLDVDKESYFNYLCAYQILYKPMMLATFAALQTLPWAIMTCAISQLDVLIYNLENIRDLVKTTVTEKQCTENEAFREVFKGCVLHHCSIIRVWREGVSDSPASGRSLSNFPARPGSTAHVTDIQYGRRILANLKLAVCLRNGSFRNKIVYCAANRLTSDSPR
ncbi:unnamed protein product [Spodoptera exigua]|nr:unnamed protein product [Spodoptera exigua]